MSFDYSSLLNSTGGGGSAGTTAAASASSGPVNFGSTDTTSLIVGLAAIALVVIMALFFLKD